MINFYAFSDELTKIAAMPTGGTVLKGLAAGTLGGVTGAVGGGALGGGIGYLTSGSKASPEETRQRIIKGIRIGAIGGGGLGALGGVGAVRELVHLPEVYSRKLKAHMIGRAKSEKLMEQAKRTMDDWDELAQKKGGLTAEEEAGRKSAFQTLRIAREMEQQGVQGANKAKEEIGGLINKRMGLDKESMAKFAYPYIIPGAAGAVGALAGAPVGALIGAGTSYVSNAKNMNREDREKRMRRATQIGAAVGGLAGGGLGALGGRQFTKKTFGSDSSQIKSKDIWDFLKGELGQFQYNKAKSLAAEATEKAVKK
jgi:hypothetical protein